MKVFGSRVTTVYTTTSMCLAQIGHVPKMQYVYIAYILYGRRAHEQQRVNGTRSVSNRPSCTYLRAALGEQKIKKNVAELYIIERLSVLCDKPIPRVDRAGRMSNPRPFKTTRR